MAACCCNSKMLASLLPGLYLTTISPSPSPARPESPGSSSTLPALRCRRPHRFSDHRLRQSHHSRRRPLFLPLVRPHHHDSRRHTRRTPGPALLRRLFLVETRNHCRCLLELLVLRKLPLHRYLHGRRPHVRITARRLGGKRWDDSFRQWSLLRQDLQIGATTRAPGWLGMLATVAWLAWRIWRDAKARD